jgi:triacylglycerol lipase
MGGLDARHMLFNDRNKGKIHEKIASLTTIGTPHLGTSFADKGISEHGELIDILKRLSLNIEGVRDLTRDACTIFNDNPEVKAFEDELQTNIELRAYTGSAGVDNVLTILKTPYKIIKEEEGDNDGLVSVSSALWQRARHKGIWKDADHLNELAWWDFAQAGTEGIFSLTKRIQAKYLEIAKELPAIS